MDDVKFNLLDKKIEKIDIKIDKVLAHANNTDITLTAQAADIRHHIARTDALEAYVSTIESDVIPLKKTMAMVQGAMKFIGIIATVVSFVAGLVKIYQFIF